MLKPVTTPDPSSLTDLALRERIAYLQAVPESDELGDDNLTGAGWAELHALEAEQERRDALRCGLCRGTGPLAPGRTICAACAHFPLD